MSTLTSTLKLSVMDGVSSKMRAITGSMSGLMRQSRQVMSPINSTIAGVAGLAAGYIGVREGLRGTVGAAMGFESSFADVRKVVEGSDNQLNTLRRDIIALSKEMPVSAEGFAQIYAAAGQSNIPIQEMKKFSKTVAEVSTAWEVPVAQTGQALAEIKNQLRMNVDEISLYADAINHIGNNTAARAPDLVDFSKRVAATGELYGFAATETLAFGGAMISAGAQSEVASTSFRNMGRALTIGERATKSHRTAFSALGLDSVKVAKSMQKNAVKTTLDVIDRIQKLPEWQRISIASALFGDEARALMPVINNATDLRRQLELVGDQANYAGSSFEEYRIRAQTTANTLDKVKNNFIALGIGIGDSFLPTINSAMTGVLDVFDTLDKRSGIFEKFNIGMKGFMSGLGFKDARELINGLADGLLGPVLDPKGMSDAGESLGRLFMKMKDWGQSLREFSIAIKENPITGFLVEIGGQGFKLVLLATGISLVAKSIFRLTGALLALSGAKMGWSLLKGVTRFGAGFLGAGAVGAAAGTGAGTVAAGGGIMAQLGMWSAKSAIAAFGFKVALASGALITFYKVLSERKPTDERFSKPDTWKDPILESNDRLNQGRVSAPRPNELPAPDAKPFSFGSLFSDLWKPIPTSQPTVSLTAPTIADLNKPSGTQDVRLINPAPSPNVNNYVTIHATTQASPAEIGAAAADAVGQATKAAMEASHYDGSTM